MGKILGIMMVEYYMIRRREMKVDEIYKEKGELRLKKGWNIRELIEFEIGELLY